MNQIVRSGSSFFDARPRLKNRYSKQRFLSLVALCLSLFLIGSCNERATFMDFALSKPDLSQMEKGDLLRYAYALQAGLMNDPQDIHKLRTVDIKLALADPDLARADGQGRVWQYRADSCVLDVHWQEKNQDIQHYEFRERQVVSQKVAPKNIRPQEWRCIQTLIQDRRQQVENNLNETYAVLSLNAQRS